MNIERIVLKIAITITAVVIIQQGMTGIGKGMQERSAERNAQKQAEKREKENAKKQEEILNSAECQFWSEQYESNPTEQTADKYRNACRY